MAPFLLHYLSPRPHHRKVLMWLGAVVVVVSSLAAAFSKTPLQIIITQGLLYGIGGGLLFAPSVSFVDEWFVSRRGLANGIFFGSNNISAAALSPIFSFFLNRYGPRLTLLLWSLTSGILISICMFCVHPRRAKLDYEEDACKVRLKSLRKPLFLLFALSMMFQGLSNFLPSAYLPSYASDFGIPARKGALLITTMSLSGVIGQPLLGLLTDSIGPLVPLLLSTLVSGFSIIIIWGFGRVYWTMVIQAILFGAFSFSFIVLRSHMAAAVVDDASKLKEQLFVSGALMATRGLACIVSGYLGAAVVASGESTGPQPSYGGGKWRGLIIYLAVLMLGASVGGLGLRRKDRGFGQLKE
ncbi:MFS general substrate transporter [Ophiocordyceps camponoti-floridani]|uniref:MFS general substrate transporter n=1 Tax=Ophiocordyceps camponoti-floridani TaxID=2030778 RepID=A0A8H4Q3H8_9HYPO|nr:MFS general substrate transporter [Ophiocordyceps camponoti-floridani]